MVLGDAASKLETFVWIFNYKVETAESKSLSLRKLRHFLISKTCFDVTNIIVSYKIFEKPLGLI